MDIVASLCNIYDTSEDEVRKTMEKANNLIADILKKKPCLASECKTETLENIDKGSFDNCPMSVIFNTYFLCYPLLMMMLPFVCRWFGLLQ